MSDLQKQLDQIFTETIDKLILSSKRIKDAPHNKVVIRQKRIKGEVLYQAEQYTDTQVFHRNMPMDEAKGYIIDQIETSFKQIDAYTDAAQYVIKCSKSDRIAAKRKPNSQPKEINLSHNREKSYLLKEGTVVPPLVDLGVITPDGKIIRSRYDKFKQINRFLELIEDGVGNYNGTLNIIDFGCGKSYLTFILYYYLTEIKGIKANILGLDLKKDVIEHCNQIAKKYGYNSLRFELGDINGYQADFEVDMVITLHACDTATDYALYNAVCWGAKMIYSVPCCQHEFNKTLHSERLALLSRYGIVKERVAALATDAVRGALLEAQGYNTQLLEFIDIAHSPKNILIRAVKGKAPAQEQATALKQAEDLIREFGVSSSFYNLLYNK